MNGLEFLVFNAFAIHIANTWQSNIDCEIKQIRNVHPSHRQSLFFLAKGPP